MPGLLPPISVALSTSSVYPQRTPDAFDIAGRLGYDGVEVMVYTDPVSQNGDALARLADYHQVPVLAVHAPSLLLTQLVWGREPWAKLMRAKDLAERLGAKTVVLHPPFRWQRDYVRGFEEGMVKIADETDVIFAVENMFPIRAGTAEMSGFAPHWDPNRLDVPSVTIDLSHTAASGSDAMAMANGVSGRLAHVHLADGIGDAPQGVVTDEHLVPGRGRQPCAELLRGLAATGYQGIIVAEVNTRRASREERIADLAETLAFAREHLSAVAAG